MNRSEGFPLHQIVGTFSDTNALCRVALLKWAKLVVYRRTTEITSAAVATCSPQFHPKFSMVPSTNARFGFDGTEEVSIKRRSSLSAHYHDHRHYFTGGQQT